MASATRSVFTSRAPRYTFWRRLRRLLIAAGLCAGIPLIVWTVLAIRPRAEAHAALISNAGVAVVDADTHVTFSPARSSSATGLLFVAGAVVDPVSYAPILRRVAEARYTGILMKLPRRGVFGGLDGPDVLMRGTSVLAECTRVERWVVAGHSLGGGVAARFVDTFPEKFVALVLIGSSGPRGFSLARTPLSVTQIYGTRDTVEAVDQLEQNLGNLPTSTRRIRIDGGNHSQFAYYGLQPGDWPASITREQQQRVMMSALLDVLARADR